MPTSETQRPPWVGAAERHPKIGVGAITIRQKRPRPDPSPTFYPLQTSKKLFFELGQAEAEKATVEIMAASGTQTFRANRSGWVRLKLDAALLRENPEVRVSTKPKLIRLDVVPTLDL